MTHRENNRRSTSPSAKQAQQTHCKRGHPFDATNTYHYRGKRLCTICRAEQHAAYMTRRRADPVRGADLRAKETAYMRQYRAKYRAKGGRDG